MVSHHLLLVVSTARTHRRQRPSSSPSLVHCSCCGGHAGQVGQGSQSFPRCASATRAHCTGHSAAAGGRGGRLKSRENKCRGGRLVLCTVTGAARRDPRASALDITVDLLWQETFRVAMGEKPTNAAGRRSKSLIKKHGGLKRVWSLPPSACSRTA